VGDIQRSGTAALAALLTRAREDAALTRRELAERTGLSYPYISQLETGYRGPSAEAMQRLTEALGVPVEAMVTAMADRDTPHPRMNKPNPRTGTAQRPPAQPSAYKKQSQWFANPAWAPLRPAAFAPVPPAADDRAADPVRSVDAASSTLQQRPHRALAHRLAASEPTDERETLVTQARQAGGAAPLRPATDTVVAEIVARLRELPPGQRLSALTEIQNHVVRTVVEDAAGSSGESDRS